MNPNKCPCECHEDFDHGSALVVAEYAKRIRDLEAEKDLWLSVRDQMLADIANLKEDVKRYRNG